MVVGVLLFIDLGIMTTWQVADPFYRETKQMEPYVSAFISIEHDYKKKKCETHESSRAFSSLVSASSFQRRYHHNTGKRVLSK